MIIKPDRPIIICGSSGSGKSTILSLLMRFYDVDQGEILLDGINIKYLNINWLRKQFGYVLQEATLFNDTVKNNICLCGEDDHVIKYYMNFLVNSFFI